MTLLPGLVLGRVFFSLASSLKIVSFGTASTVRTALFKRSHGVLPGTLGGGSGFMRPHLPLRFKVFW